MSAGKIAEYAVGILVPLGMFLAEERGWFLGVVSCAGDPEVPKGDPGGGGEGGVAPATLPLLESGTPRTLAGVPEIGGKRCPGPISNRAGPVMAP